MKQISFLSSDQVDLPGGLISGTSPLLLWEIVGKKFWHEVSVYGFKDPGIHRGFLWFTILMTN